MRVLALIHCDVPASSRAFLIHTGTSLHISGRWSESNPQPKQNAWPVPQWTMGTSVRRDSPRPPDDHTVSVQPGRGQNRKLALEPTYDWRSNSLYLLYRSVLLGHLFDSGSCSPIICCGVREVLDRGFVYCSGASILHTLEETLAFVPDLGLDVFLPA